MEHLTRQWDLIPVDKLNKKIHIIGAGAIGSHAALMLAKMGATDITVYDFDDVSIENMNSQGYRFKDIGYKKVHALKQIILEYTGLEIKTVVAKITPDNMPSLSGVVLMAADSMTTRRELFTAIRESCPMVTHVIDTRMGAEDAMMYVMQPQEDKDMATYAKTLYDDKDAVQERCTAKATIYTANLLSGYAVKAVKNIICNQPYARTSLWSIQHNDLKAWTV